MLRMLVLVCLCLLAALAPRAAAQDNPSLVAGSIAPPLSIEQWPLGVPVTRFERGRVYVVEFWATWCTPCHLVVPKLTELQRNNPALTVIAVAGAEQATTVNRDDRLEKVQDYITKRHEEIGFTIAYDGSGAMWRDWMVPAQRGGIPAAFIVGPDGRLTWIGNPLVPDFEKELVATLARSDVNRTPSPTRYTPGVRPQRMQQRPITTTPRPSTWTPTERPLRAAMPQASLNRTAAPKPAPREIRIEFVPESANTTDSIGDASPSITAVPLTSAPNTQKPAAKPVSKTAAKPATKTASKPAGTSSNKPAGKPTKKPASKPATKPASKPAKR